MSAATNRAIRQGMAVYDSDRPQTIEAFLALLPENPQKVAPPSGLPQSIDPGLRVARNTFYVTIVGIKDVTQFSIIEGNVLNFNQLTDAIAHNCPHKISFSNIQLDVLCHTEFDFDLGDRIGRWGSASNNRPRAINTSSPTASP